MLTQVPRHPNLFTVAERSINILSPSHYPGAPFSLGYLENLSGVEARHNWALPSYQLDRKGIDYGRKGVRSCTERRNGSRSEVQGYMSQRNPASDPPSNTPHRDSPSLPPPSPSLPRPETSHYAPQELPNTTEIPVGAARATLPPLGPATPAHRLPPLQSDPAPPRSIGVHSILNPSHHEVQSPRQIAPARTTAQLSSPTTTAAAAELPRIAKRSTRDSSYPDEGPGPSVRGERPVLTAKSQAERAASTGSRRNYGPGPPVPYTAVPSPGPRGEGRPYAADPGYGRYPDVPSLPPPPPGLMTRSAGSYPPVMDSAPSQPRRASSGRHPFAPAGDSPSTSQSSYGHYSQASPRSRYVHQHLATSLPTGPARTPASLPPDQQSALGLHEGQLHGSTGSYGISIPTGEGGQIMLPVVVDVEQASKTANEKRKRNAGASARFRQRRKEKERESSQTISSLERNMRGLEEERNHYRSERDFFRDIYLREVGPRHLPQRPITPHFQMLARHSSIDTTGQWQDISRETSEPPRNVRRRTSSYPTPYPGPPTAPPMMPSQSQAYGYSPPQPMPILQNPFAPRPPGHMAAAPPASHQQQQQPPPPSQPQPLSPRSVSAQDAYRRDMYSNRSWNPGP